MNQWKNTNDVINWFKNIKNKTDHTMICFDICDFYPSITNALLQKALMLASKYSTISKEDIDIIKHTKRTTLYKDGQPWEKITSKFDVTMASYDGAEICELVGLYLLSQMQDRNINIGLYRHDGLAITKQTPREVEMTKKKLCKIFRENDLSITVEANKTVVDFLDITLNLSTGAYKPYKNPMTPSITSIVKVTIRPLLSKNYQKALGYDFLQTHPVKKYFRKQQNHTTTV